MPSGKPAARNTPAFDPAYVRRAMLERVIIPQGMVSEAIRKTYEKLYAKETKFFTHKGVVTDTRVVEDHGTQLQAADQIHSIAGLYSRDSDSKPSSPKVALEVDPRTGVIRIVLGSDEGGDVPQVINGEPVITRVVSDHPSLAASHDEQLSLSFERDNEEMSSDETQPYELVHVRRGALAPEVKEILFGNGGILEGRNGK